MTDNDHLMTNLKIRQDMGVNERNVHTAGNTFKSGGQKANENFV